ncbi:MAG: hypothetical protein ACJ0G4_03885 [Alphaproteobacteria bacterium]
MAVSFRSGCISFFQFKIFVIQGIIFVSSTDLYGGTYNLFSNTLKEMGIECRFV